MTDVKSLPSDILFDILVNLGDLQHLWFAIYSCRQLYQAFEQRRLLILRQVFGAQLNRVLGTKVLPHSLHVKRNCERDVGRALTAARAVVDRCKSTPQDALCLHAAAWDIFAHIQRDLGLDCSWGQQLVERYVALGEHDSALHCADRLWRRLMGAHTTKRQEPHRDNGKRCRQGAVHANLTQKLVSLHLDAGHHEDAIGMLRSCYDLMPDFKGYGLVSEVLKYYRESNKVTELQLLPFFQERIVKDEAVNLAGGRSSGVGSASSRFRWTYCIVMVLKRAGRHDEAIQAVSEALDLALRDRSIDPVPVGLSRKLIKMLQEQQRYDEGLTVRKRILDVLSSTRANVTNGWTSQYVAWTKEYTSDLRAMRREEEALRTEEQVWTRLKARAAAHIDAQTLYRARNAAWTLARSYRAQNDMKKADEVRRQYELLANARPEKVGGGAQLLWPGTLPVEVLSADDTRMHMPIMVSRSEAGC